jgi:hypothetical protein
VLNVAQKAPPHAVASVASPHGLFRLLGSRGFNTKIAHRANVRRFQQCEFTPVRLPDAPGVSHEFHCRSLLPGDRLSLDAFENANPDEAFASREGLDIAIMRCINFSRINIRNVLCSFCG